MVSKDKRLLRLFRALDEQGRETLLAFAEFLDTQRAAQPPSELPRPKLIPRPSRESVVAAIKRLSASYSMLDKGRMLNETSSLMTQHVMQGRPADEVVDELEKVFRRHYEQFERDSPLTWSGRWCIRCSWRC